MEATRETIPKKIHYIWFGKSQPEYMIDNISKMKEMYPDYELKIWTDKDFNPKSIRYTHAALKKKKYAFISDYVRAKILYEEGGIYVDADIIPIKDIAPLLNNSMTLGFEYSRLLTTGFVASLPNNQFYRRILETYHLFDLTPSKKVKFLINNDLWTYVLKTHYGLKLSGKLQVLSSDIKIYPEEYFSSMKKLDDSYFVHDHQLSWMSKRKIKVSKVMLPWVKKYQTLTKPFLSIITRIQFSKQKRIIKKLEKIKTSKVMNDINND